MQYYKTIAPYYDLIIPRDIKGICNSVEAIVKRYGGKRNILDLGCGTGRFSIELAKRGYRVTGLDVTEEMLAVAKLNAEKARVKIKYLRGDIRSFKLPRKVDIIWARGSIGDIIQIEDIKRALIGIRNNLKKGGIFIFDVRDDSGLQGKIRRSSLESRVIKKRDMGILFRFSRDLNRRKKTVTINAEITVKGKKYYKKHKTNHVMRYYAKKEISELLTKAKFKTFEIFHGYELEKIKLPRIVAVAQK